MAYSKIIVGALVLGIVAILIFSAPAQAFISSIDIKNNVVDKGETVTININVNTQDNEKPTDISFLILKLRGPNAVDCKFLSNATIVSGCDDIIIEEDSTTDTGDCSNYGYGPGCSIKYKITINTEFFDLGTYITSLIINANGKETTQQGENIIINQINKVCSLRASKGTIIVEEKQYFKNKLNFYVPLRRASNGDGYLAGQDDKNSLTYRFKVDKVMTMTDGLTRVQVSGKYRIGIFGNYTNETSIITIDKINNVTSIVGNKINANGMKISFRQFC